MIVVLLIVIALIYGFVWLLRKFSNPKVINDPYLKRTASLTLSPGKTVEVVTLKDRAFLIGVAENSINLISEITDKELIDAMNLNAASAAESKPKDFASILSSFTKSSKKTEDYLRTRREGFKDTEKKK